MSSNLVPCWVFLTALIAVPSAGRAQEGTPRSRLPLTERFQRLDLNRDGKLTADELRRPALFKRLDGNGDGEVTLEEARASLTRFGRRAGRPPSKDEVPPLPEVRRALDVPYATMEGVDPKHLSLDLYAPVKGGKHPVMMMVHGGGWAFGDKAGSGQTRLKVPHFVGQGYVYVSINYRLSPRVKHPAHVKDVAAALAWLHEHVAAYGGDPDRMFIMGHSAGSHLVSLVATDERYLRAHGKDLRIIKGVVALDSPGFDIPRLLPLVNAGLRRMYERAFTRDPDIQKDASPLTHVAKGKHIPPFLIIPSGQRRGAVRKIFDDMASALRQAGSPARVVEAVGKNHAMVNRDIGKVGEAETRIIMAFLAGKAPPELPPRTQGNNKRRL
jgi:acetyl esterase/lipase